jgi:hypothetical protein
VPEQTESEVTIPNYAHDIFRRKGLGRVSQGIWEQIHVKPQDDEELSLSIGSHIETIRTNLRKMNSITDRLTGEMYSMVEKREDGKYHPLPVDLDKLAQVLGVAGMTEKQKNKHNIERVRNSIKYNKGKIECSLVNV